MVEKNFRMCKLCKQLKHRIQDGLYNAKDKRWVDETKLLWNGSICPQCNKLRVRNRMREIRGQSKQ